MKQEVMISGIGYALLNSFNCPKRSMWNFWKHTPQCRMDKAQTGLVILDTPPRA